MERVRNCSIQCCQRGSVGQKVVFDNKDCEQDKAKASLYIEY